MKTREITVTKRIPLLTKREAAKWARFTEESNNEFKAMSPVQKRVVIAQNVIAQLKTNAIRAESGTYVKVEESSKFDVDEALTGIDLSIALPYMESCNVCAVGSIMICTVMRDDQVTYRGNGVSLHGDDTYETAKRFFPTPQLQAMENVFENFGTFAWTDEDWFPHHLGSNEILVLIMQHVVDAKGSFTEWSFGSWLKRRYNKKKTTKKLSPQPRA